MSEEGQRHKLQHSSTINTHLDAKLERVAPSIAEFKKRKEQEAEAAKPWTQRTKFQLVIALVIVANAVCMTIEADSDSAENEVGLLVMEHFFATVFVLEFLLHIKFEGFRVYFSELANCMDFCLVVLSVIDAWVIRQTGLDKDMDLRSASLLRMLRLLKLGRILKLLHMFRELTVILQGLVGGLRSLFWAGCFMFLLLYLFAMVGTLNFGDDPSCDVPEAARLLKASAGSGATASRAGDLSADDPGCTEFVTVPRSLLTLWLCLTEGCGDGIIKPMVLKSPQLMLFWIVFVFIGSFGMLNIIIGLFCENILQAAADAEKSMSVLQDQLRKKQMEMLKDVFMVMDTDGSRTLSHDEWCIALEMPEVHDILEKLGLGEEDDLFGQLDVDKNGLLDFEEFFDGLLMVVKGGEAAKAKDVVPTHLLCESMRKKIESMQDAHAQMNEAICDVHSKVDALQVQIQRMSLAMDDHLRSLASLEGQVPQEQHRHENHMAKIRSNDSSRYQGHSFGSALGCLTLACHHPQAEKVRESGNGTGQAMGSNESNLASFPQAPLTSAPMLNEASNLEACLATRLDGLEEQIRMVDVQQSAKLAALEDFLRTEFAALHLRRDEQCVSQE
eukprot:gnl/MRDRNA2_/MRDRNA2_148556_c0_seq1.p1 gnl/MRDRNA2_/MRDRNA2_148556_c0~~gnl/MRDRNA2_/MRDRNA2_148556_c0_seq1.p1  ORF type:complete len:615 (+),score=129.25 gnl/MRDRNA2_/MRDRNA2_148556_c0_seq1:103-1947(+)